MISDDEIVSEIMEQAQVFASTYSLVGGRFDDGTKMQQSEEEKVELERLVRSAVSSWNRRHQDQDTSSEFERWVK